MLDARDSLVVPRGRLFAPLVDLLNRSGVPLDAADHDLRELVIQRGGWRLLMARPGDVALFVEHGVAGFGFAGKDRLLEEPREVLELLDLGVAQCRLVLAVPVDHPAAPSGQLPRSAWPVRRVATKYPRLTGQYLARLGLAAQVIVMHGAVEIAPALGLADAIVDVVQTGTTLAANGLVEVDTILRSSARLIANPVTYRLRSEAVSEWYKTLRRIVGPARSGIDPAQASVKRKEATR